MSTNIGPLDIEEIKPVIFRFSKELRSGDSIAGVVITAELVAGSDATPAAILVGLPTIDNTNKLVEQLVSAPGLAGNEYLLRAVATATPSGQKHVVAARMAVVKLDGTL